MRFVALEAQNFMGLKAVRINVDGQPIVVGGENAAGKSCALNAFLAAIGGKRACPSEPVRRGEERAEILVDLDEVWVKRIFAEDGTTKVVVEHKEHGALRTPQDVLDSLFRAVPIEPEALLHDATARRNLLRSLVGESFDTGDAERTRLYDERRDLNRELKRLEAHAKSLEEALPAKDLPAEPVSSANIVAEIQAAEEHNRDIDAEQRRRDKLSDDLENGRTTWNRLAIEVERLEAELLGARAARDSARNSLVAAQSEFEALLPLPVRATTDGLVGKFARMEAINAAIRDRDAARAATEAARTADEEARRLTARMEAIDAEQTAALAATIEGVVDLEWRDGDLVFHGVPFAQCSTTEQLTVVLELAMAANTKIPTVLIRHGSLLDGPHLKHILTLCRDREYAALIERVGKDEHTSVLIHDGEVAWTPAEGYTASYEAHLASS